MRQVIWSSVALVVLGSVACSQGPPLPPFRPVANIALLMEATVAPASEILWASVATILTVDGYEDVQPETEEEWAAVEHAIVTLAESGNLLMMAPRARDDDAWMERSRQLIEASIQALDAAEARDHETLLDAGGVVYEACTMCHEEYLVELDL